MSNNKQSMEDLLKPISKNVREWLEDIGTPATIAQPKKVVGRYCLGSKTQVNCISFGTYSKPNFIKRFFMRTLLDFYWIKQTEQ